MSLKAHGPLGGTIAAVTGRSSPGRGGTNQCQGQEGRRERMESATGGSAGSLPAEVELPPGRAGASMGKKALELVCQGKQPPPHAGWVHACRGSTGSDLAQGRGGSRISPGTCRCLQPRGSPGEPHSGCTPWLPGSRRQPGTAQWWHASWRQQAHMARLAQGLQRPVGRGAAAEPGTSQGSTARPGHAPCVGWQPQPRTEAGTRVPAAARRRATGTADAATGTVGRGPGQGPAHCGHAWSRPEGQGEERGSAQGTPSVSDPHQGKAHSRHRPNALRRTSFPRN